jgi:predicted nucleic acid-binding protein
MIVLDAPVVVEILVRSRDGLSIAERLIAGGRTWHAPHVIDVEVAHALRHYAARRAMPDARAAEALNLLAALPLTRYPHDVLLERIWALRHNLSAYDAAYVALAEGLRAPLVTRDQRLASSPGIAAAIELV